MLQNSTGTEIEVLIRLLARLPGFGTRSARRVALTLVQKRDRFLIPIIKALEAVDSNIAICSVCGNIDTANPCCICTDHTREVNTLIVVETVSDLWAIERSNALLARYHVLGGAISVLDGIRPEDLSISRLIERCREGTFEEIILAVNATLEGQATAHYIMDQLSCLNCTAQPVDVTRLAYGIPVGGELDYLDDETISQALRTRIKF